MNLLEKYNDSIDKVCKSSNVKNLFTFRSILTDKFNNESDIDLIVSFDTSDPIEYAENYFELKFKLENILGRPIDLLEQKSIKNKIFENLINKRKTLIYG